jgi:hypothetical protein
MVLTILIFVSLDKSGSFIIFVSLVIATLPKRILLLISFV